MHLVTMPLSELRPAPYNPRVSLKPTDPRYRKLRRSLNQFGLVEPLVWNRTTGYLVGGHQRLQLLHDLGYTDAPVSVVELAPEQEKALNVILNNREAQGDWDLPALTSLLDEMNTFGQLDVTGFDPSHLEMLQADWTPAPNLPAEPNPDHVEITLCIPHGVLPEVQPMLDCLIRQHRLEVHVRSPV